MLRVEDLVVTEDRRDYETREDDDVVDERQRQDRDHLKRKARSGAKARRPAGSKYNGIHRRRSRRISW
jgi:hypothetical protein